jgi:hypothetical protein
MNALIAAFLLPLVLGRFFSFLAFVIVWLLGLIVYGVWFMPHDTSLFATISLLVAAGLLGQAGYFVNIFIRSMLNSGERGTGR